MYQKDKTNNLLLNYLYGNKHTHIHTNDSVLLLQLFSLPSPCHFNLLNIMQYLCVPDVLVDERLSMSRLIEPSLNFS